MLFAGIDAGQSSTNAVIGDETGAILARGDAGPGDEIGAHSSSTRLRNALEGSLASAMATADLASDTRFERIVVGISGYEGRVYGEYPQLPSDHLQLVHDSRIAHAGALGGQSGVVVIAGTGSVALAVDEERDAYLEGGWGFVFGDEGSAFWIVSKAMRGVIAHSPCPGEEKFLAFFERRTMREIARAFYMDEISRASFASFAPECIEAARDGSHCSCLMDPVFSATLQLADLAERAIHHTTRSRRMSFVGGLLNDTWFRGRVEAAARRRWPQAEVLQPKHDPAVGALILARHT
jgi:glucosamine kinase